MPEIGLRTFDRWSVASRKASCIYGNRFLADDPISDEPYSGAWDLEKGKVQLKWSQFRKKELYWLTPAVSQESLDPMTSVYLRKQQDPFTQADSIENENDQRQELLFQIRTSPFLSCREMANRLFLLHEDAKEEDPSCVGISIESLRNFYNFIQLHSSLKCPTISLTPDYNIYASWKEERKRLFSVHFLPGGEVRFVIFRPNDRHPERQIRISGVATTDILMETVKPYGVWDWVSE